ncbi:hypothetical protein, partial [Enterobacter ludwigii]|uniref:hypothetical protein n=1 Tax=Enterobacter ludwigii TaxID=299767 RepID=UPI002FD15A5B
NMMTLVINDCYMNNNDKYWLLHMSLAGHERALLPLLCLSLAFGKKVYFVHCNGVGLVFCPNKDPFSI